MRTLLMLCVLVGCTDSVETTWTMQLSYNSTSCAMSDRPKLWLIERDGNFESSFEHGGRQMIVEATSDASYTVTITEAEMSASLQVHLTPSNDDVFALDGLGVLDSSGSRPCHDTFTLTGTSFPEDVGCGRDEQDCAVVLGWEWGLR